MRLDVAFGALPEGDSLESLARRFQSLRSASVNWVDTGPEFSSCESRCFTGLFERYVTGGAQATIA